jgi:FAD/FMN-containing dehydrogenase
VKGGGHSTAPLSCAPTPEGAVLDLGLLRDISVNVANKTVTYGGGCTWAEVDDALCSRGLATVCGTISHTGVGGLVLHGGFGFLSGLHGLAVDCLVSVEMVLANGEAVTASETENPDLFWVVRGAGSSFGVVTSFTSKVFPQGEVWAGLIFYTLDKLPKLVDFLNFWAANNDGRQVANMAFTHAPPSPDPAAPRPPLVGMHIVHLGSHPAEEGPAFFAPLLDIDALVKQVGMQTYPQVNKGGDTALFPPGRRYLLCQLHTPGASQHRRCHL